MTWALVLWLTFTPIFGPNWETPIYLDKKFNSYQECVDMKKQLTDKDWQCVLK